MDLGQFLDRLERSNLLTRDDLDALHAEIDLVRYVVQVEPLGRKLVRRGQLTGKTQLTDRMRQGEIFVPFVKLAESAANFLTNAAFDPESKIPEYKVCAVRIEKIPVE